MQNCIVAKKGYKWQRLSKELIHYSRSLKTKWSFGLQNFFKGIDMSKINFNDVFKPLVLSGSKIFTARFSEKEQDFKLDEVDFRAIEIHRYPLRVFLHYTNDGRYSPTSFGFATVKEMFDFYNLRAEEKKLSSQHTVYIYQLFKAYSTKELF